ncbi:MAG: hypothetical protein Q8N93_05895 [Bacillota bacterium]|nr:hypothetical protein [Bacillota bacterium]
MRFSVGIEFVESVTADGNKVTFTLSRPYAPFLEWVAGVGW